MEHGSFGTAASHLDYTQSSISQQIASLERMVGEALVDRSAGSHPIRLTPCGELVLAHGRAVLAQLTAAHADVAALADVSAARLRVGAFQSIGAVLLPAVLRRIAGDGAASQVELTQTTADGELSGGLPGTWAACGGAQPPSPDPLATATGPGPAPAAPVSSGSYVPQALGGVLSSSPNGGPTGGSHELVTAAPRRYPVTGAALVEADRGDRVPTDLEPCGIEHARNLCGTRMRDATHD